MLPPCVIVDPPTFGIRTLRRSGPACMLLTICRSAFDDGCCEEGNDDALLMRTRRMTIASLVEASRSSSSGLLDDCDDTKQGTRSSDVIASLLRILCQLAKRFYIPYLLALAIALRRCIFWLRIATYFELSSAFRVHPPLIPPYYRQPILEPL